jgi:Fur family transcriptional regulator, peroxide stress response regulator
MSTLIQRKKFKRSRQRERILETLRGTKSHPTAGWVYDVLKKEYPELSLGTVYRNLNILNELGLVRILRSGSTFDRFDADTSPHYHFVCEDCGKVEDVELSVDLDLNSRVSALMGRTVTGHRLDFYGICPDCRANQESVAG